MLETFQLFAVCSAAVFTGAAIYINLVEHPARMSCSTTIAATVWIPSYQRATTMQASLAFISFVSGVISWLLGGDVVWLWGAVLVGSVIPYTFGWVMSLNAQLLDSECHRSSEETRRLLNLWGRKHMVRSFLSFVGLGCYFWALIGVGGH